jgi:hypothetical protein
MHLVEVDLRHLLLVLMQVPPVLLQVPFVLG